jgi:TetR/AcrR family transcriptional regulator, lmrAB and yxaGH operons repressor
MAMVKEEAPSIRDQILEAAITLIKQSGLSGSGINQILEHSGAPRGSLYYYFPGGKQQIVIESLTLYGDRVAGAFERVLSSKKTPADKISALFHFVADRFTEGLFAQSCAVGAVTLDLGADTAKIQLLVETIFKSWQAIIAQHLPIINAVRRDSLAGLILSMIEGAYVRGRAERSAQPFLEAEAWFVGIVQQLE